MARIEQSSSVEVSPGASPGASAVGLFKRRPAQLLFPVADMRSQRRVVSVGDHEAFRRVLAISFQEDEP